MRNPASFREECWIDIVLNLPAHLVGHDAAAVIAVGWIVFGSVE